MDDRTAQDQRVVGEVLQGNHDAFAQIVGRYQKLVASVAWRYGVGREEMEDVVSEVFFKVYRNLNQYRPDHPFSTWLYRLAANHVMDHGRRKKREGSRTELPDDLGDPAPGPSERAEAGERATALRRALAELKPRYREVLFLVYIEGLQVGEAAHTLGLPEGTIKSRLLRGRAALRGVLDRRHPALFAS